MTSQLLATLHPKIKPSKPNIGLKMPFWTPQEGPRRAQDSPRWAQGGPKKGRHATSKSRKIIPGAFWASLGAILDSNWPFQAHLATNFTPKLFLTGPQDPDKISKQSLRPSTARPGMVMQTPTTSTPKNQTTNPQAFGVGSAECAERSAAPEEHGVLN